MTLPKIRTSTQVNNDSGFGGGAVATDSIWDAKGDLAGGTGANTAAKLTVGADDTILMADAAASTGLKWVASASPSAVGTAAATGTSDDFSRGSHVHAHEAAHINHDTTWAAKGDVIAATANDTAAVVTVGADGTKLEASSGAASGVAWVGHRGAHAYNSANIAITTAVSTIVTLDSERYDTDAFHSTSSNTSRLTVPTGLDGYYIICAQVQYAANATGGRDVRIKKNGTTYLAIQTSEIDENLQHRCNATILAALVATDYVEMEVRQTSGGNLNIETANNHGIEFMMARFGV